MEVAARCIVVTGAAGCGTSTLGRALGGALASQQFDADDLFWRPTDPPFTAERPVPERIALAEALFAPRRDWVLSGSVMGWDDAIAPRLTHAILLTAPTQARLARLRERETRRGVPGGDPAFIEWAGRYDEPGFGGRSRARHEAWLSGLGVPVIRLDAAPPPEAVLREALRALGA